MGIKYIEHVNGTATPDKVAVEYALRDSEGNKINETYLKTVDQAWSVSPNGGMFTPTNAIWGQTLYNGIIAATNTNEKITSVSNAIKNYSESQQSSIVLGSHTKWSLSTSHQAGSTTYTLNSNAIQGDNSISQITTDQLFFIESSVGAQQPTSVTISSNKVVLTFSTSLNPTEAATSIYGGINIKAPLTAGVNHGPNFIAGASIISGAAESIIVGSMLNVPDGARQLVVAQNGYSNNGPSVLVGARVKNTGKFATLIGDTLVNSVKYGALFGLGHNSANGPEAIFATGKYSDITSTTLFAVGKGTAANARSNAFEVHTDGRATLGADPTANMDAVTKKYVDDNFAKIINVAGTSGTEGTATLTLGNSSSSGTAGNLTGVLQLYDYSGQLITIRPREISTHSTGATFYLPNWTTTASTQEQCLVGYRKSIISSTWQGLGSNKKPVYIDGNGMAQTADDYPFYQFTTQYWSRDITIDSTPATGCEVSGNIDLQAVSGLTNAINNHYSIVLADDGSIFDTSGNDYQKQFYLSDNWDGLHYYFIWEGTGDDGGTNKQLLEIESSTGDFKLYNPTYTYEKDSSDTSTFLRHDGTWAVPSGGTGGVTITLNGTTTTTPSFYAPTGAGTSGYVLKSGGSGAPSWAAESDEKLRVAAATSGSSYNILLGSGLSAATRQISDEIYFIPGLSSGVQTNSTLYIGSAGNGQICLQVPVSKDKRYTYLKPATDGLSGSSAAINVYLPKNSAVSGAQNHYLISATQRGTAIGGSTQGVYIDTNGVVTAGSTYAGGTAVTLNGTSAAASTASFYAPTGAGTSGQYLTSSGSGAPTWVDAIWRKATSGGIVYPTNNPVAADYNIGNVIIFGADTINGDNVKTSSGTKGTILLHGNITIGLNASAPAASTSYVFPAAANLALPDGNLSYITNFLFSTPGQDTAAQKPTSITMGTGITLNFASSINPSSAASSIQGGIDASGSKGSLIIGNAITTTAQNTFLMGNFIYNTGTWTVAIGQGLYNTAQSNFILGSRNKSSGNRSLIIGTDHLSTVSNSVLLGKGHDTTNGIANIVAVGQYSSITSTSAFVIGNGTATDARSNAFEVKTDGTATVGAAPTSDMDVATKKYVDDRSFLWITPGTTTWSEVVTAVTTGGIVAYKSTQTQLAGAQEGKIFYMSEYSVTGSSSLSGTMVLTSTGRVISNNTTYPGYEELIWTLSGTSSSSTITIAGATHNVVSMIDADSTSY